MIKRMFQNIDQDYLFLLTEAKLYHKKVWRYQGYRYVLDIKYLEDNYIEVTFSDIIKENWFKRLLRGLSK